MRILTAERRPWEPSGPTRKQLVRPEHYGHLEPLDEPLYLVDAETNRVVAAQLMVPESAEATVELVSHYLRIGLDWEPEGPRASGIAYAQRTFGTSAPSPIRRRYGCAPNSTNLDYPELGKALDHLATVWHEMFFSFDAEQAEKHTEIVNKNIHRDWQMDGAPWTSGVINRTAALPYHRDSGNLIGSWSVMLAIRRGVAGGHLHLPEYDVLLGIPNNSVTFFDGQGTWHGVTPFEIERKDAYRFTLVWYSKTLCRSCGPKEQETERAQKAATLAYGKSRLPVADKDRPLGLAEPGRLAEPVTELEPGMDFRLPEYRREVFHRFYQFHLKYGAHPGCVYYLIPYLREAYGWDDEQTLWFAFLNGNTQNPVVSWLLHKRFPGPESARAMLDWFEANYERLPFDTDRRHHKKNLAWATNAYTEHTRAGQELYWRTAARSGFRGVWAAATAIPSFGRLSAFSYAEYLRIAGMPFDCDDLLLEDMSGSKSHRNGLAKVCGRDDLDWHDSNPYKFEGNYSDAQMSWLKQEGELLLQEARARSIGQPYEKDVSYFTLESALCTYKSWHRLNRRYPNVYNDMLYGRIKKCEALWPEEDFGIFWQARRELLPEQLRLEDNPHDPGCVPVKQNHYRKTGQVVMMDEYDPTFVNDFNDWVRRGELPVRKELL